MNKKITIHDLILKSLVLPVNVTVITLMSATLPSFNTDYLREHTDSVTAVPSYYKEAGRPPVSEFALANEIFESVHRV